LISMRALILMSISLLLLLGCTGSEETGGPSSGGQVTSTSDGLDTSSGTETGDQVAGGTGSPDTGSPAGTDPIADAKGPLITPQELAQHGSADDCYVRYIDQVYDATRFIPLHPGGPERITMFCGKADDSFETAFLKQHPGSEFVVKLMQMTDYVGYME